MMTRLRWRLWHAAGQGSNGARPGKFLIYAVIAATAAGPGAWAADQDVRVKDPWMRLIIPARPAGGYFTLSNERDEPIVLIGAASPDCGTIMLHQSMQQSGQDRMVMLKSLIIPAHGQVDFAPGGYHLMCLSPSRDVKPGHVMSVTLRFAHHDAITASFPVRNATGG